ncbi:MAG: FISUMP domain-containing protein [Mariniphaga sp.]
MKTRKILAVFVLVLVLFTNAFSQSPGVAINTDGTTPHASAMLDVSSTTKGFLPPRMTNTQKTIIASPVAGLLIWCTNCGTSGELQIYNGITWTNFVGGAASAGKPDAPTIGTATVSGVSGTATVTFTAPASNGGAAITSYTATSSPGSLTATLSQAGSGTITFTGLTNGTAYTFTVTATNSVGTGAASDPSNSVTPCTVPGVPTIGTATAGNAQATVTFNAPASNGGSAITSYTATSSPGGFTGIISQAGSGTITITGLTVGTAYTFTVKATNAAGAGAASAASNSVTPYGVPGAPTIGTAIAGDTKATVTFTAPVSNGGSVITSYTATSTPGGFTGTLSQAGNGTITITGLTNGTAYTFKVTATNAAGTGAASAASNSVTPNLSDGSGNTYQTVTIGTQIWMTKNLNTTTYNDGTTIPNVTSDKSWAALTSGAWCDNTNGQTTFTTYGKLYNFYVVDNNATTKSNSNGGKNVCPIGWHVPTDAEWTTLTTYLGGISIAGGKLMETGTTHWIAPNTVATNSSGFTALPGGKRESTFGLFGAPGPEGFWWTCSADTYSKAFSRYLFCNQINVTSYIIDKKSGHSVRCLKD